jgi:hypothetical protein
MAGEVGFGDLFRVASLEIFLEARPANSDLFFRLATIEQVKARRSGSITVGMRFNDVGHHVSWTWQCRFQELFRDAPFVDVLRSKDKKAVGAGRQSALDGKDVAQSQLPIVFDGRASRELRPLAGMPEHVEKEKCLLLRPFNRPTEREPRPMLRPRGRFAADKQRPRTQAHL